MTARLDPEAVADHIADVIPLTGRGRPREASAEEQEAFRRSQEAPEDQPRASGVDPTEVPNHLLSVPGLVGHIARYITKTARFPQPLLSLAAALGVVGTVAGRITSGPTKSGTHLYLLTLAPTGGGKAHPAKIGRRLLRAANMSEMMGPGRFQSETAVYQTLGAKPQLICFMDEFGSYLQKMNDPRQSSSHERAISGALRQFWGASFDTVDPPAWAASSNTKLLPIHSPSLSLFGMSVHEEFYAALQSADIANGFLNRFLVLPTMNKPEEVEPELDDDDVPPALIEGLQRVGYTPAGWDAANSGRSDWKPYRRFTWAGDEVSQAYKGLQRSVRDHPEGSKLLSRTAEMAVRLATIRAIGRDAMNPSVAGPLVSLEDFAWAAELAMWCGQRMVDDAASYMVESDHQGRVNEILRHIKGAKRGQLTQTDLYRKVKHKFNAAAITDVLRSLQESEQIEITRHRADGAKKPTDVIRYLGG